MSEEKTKGGIISLRKKKTVTTRPKISAPIISSQSVNESTPQLRVPDWNPPPRNDTESDVPAPRPRPSISGGTTDRTADLVKRRYSTRFAQPHDNELPPPIPGIPQLPRNYASSKASSRAGRSPDRRDGQRLRLDLKALRDAHLQPEQCPCHLHPKIPFLTSHN